MNSDKAAKGLQQVKPAVVYFIRAAQRRRRLAQCRCGVGPGWPPSQHALTTTRQG